jgi:cytochrome c2
MKIIVLAGAALVGALALGGAASAADAAHGQMLFRSQCGVCHMAGEGDGDGGQGPSLKGVIGRKVGGDDGFGTYSDALLNAKAVWTEQSLAAYLENPQKAYPGSAMPIKVAAPDDRADIAAYLATVKAAP